VSYVNLVFILLWISMAILVRRRYLGTLLQSIRQRRLDARRQFAPVLDRSTAELLAKQLASSDPRAVLYALEVFGASQGKESHPRVRDLLAHEDPAVRRRRCSTPPATCMLPRVEEMLRIPTPTSVGGAFFAHRARRPLTRIKELDAFQDVSVVSGIVTFLARPGDGENLPEARVVMDGMIGHRGEAGKPSRLEAASLIGMLGDEFDAQLDALLADEDPEVVRLPYARREAAAARGAEADRFLGDARLWTRRRTLAALGDRVLGVLRDQLTDGTPHWRSVSKFPVSWRASGTRS
jgi:hypothetical protein